MTTVETGMIVAEKFLVRGVLGEGGQASVVEAEHLVIGSRVAIKVFHDDRPDVLARFGREARNAARVSSPHVAPVFDAGRLSDGRPFLVMERVEGETLEERMSKGLVGPEELREIARQLLAGLSAIHAAGIVHRDVKPANIVLQSDGATGFLVRLLDFGISDVLDAEHGGSDAAISGTPSYMAPEQIIGEAPTPALDLFAVGVILYEMATGRLPFEGQSHTEILAAVLHHEPPPPDQLVPAIPRSLSQVILQALRRNPEARFDDAEEMSKAIEGACPSRASAPSFAPSLLTPLRAPQLFEEDDAAVARLPLMPLPLMLVAVLCVGACAVGWAVAPPPLTIPPASVAAPANPTASAADSAADSLMSAAP